MPEKKYPVKVVGILERSARRMTDHLVPLKTLQKIFTDPMKYNHWDQNEKGDWTGAWRKSFSTPGCSNVSLAQVQDTIMKLISTPSYGLFLAFIAF